MTEAERDLKPKRMCLFCCALALLNDTLAPFAQCLFALLALCGCNPQAAALLLLARRQTCQRVETEWTAK